VPADYQKIRDENIARYGWDTAVLDLLGRLYSDRTHFIFELIQNAEDAGATEMAFELYRDRLEVRHDGRPFTESDVRGVCGVGASTKAADLTAIGQFGIGFKSVYAYTRSLRIYSGPERFRIENYVRPVALGPADPGPAARGEPGRETRFVFPFDHDAVPPATAAREIAAALDGFDPLTLLFLRHVRRVEVGGEQVTAAVIERASAPDPEPAGRPAGEAATGTRRRVTLAKRPAAAAQPSRHQAAWLVWHRDLGPSGHPGQRVEIAFRLAGPAGGGRVAGCPGVPLVVFFPTEKQTFLGFVVQGPYRTTPARDNVPEHDPANQRLARETAVLLGDVLRDLRASGLLTAAVLEALPLDEARFPPGSLLRPLFDAVRAALAADALIPAAGGGHAAAAGLRLASDPGLRRLLAPGQLGLLYQQPEPLRFTAETISPNETPQLYRYLHAGLGVGELTGEGLAGRLSAEFLAAQPDEWITALYAYLDAWPGLWREAAGPGERPGPARQQPILRLEDGRHVPPGDTAAQAAAYLPAAGPDGGAVTGLPVIRRAIADVPAARRFLAALGLAEPDLVGYVLDAVLPRYAGLDIAALDPVQHDADLEAIIRAAGDAPAARREQLLPRLRETAFLAGENAATGERRLLPPPQLYQRSKDLEEYFGGNPAAWFAADEYGPWLAQLRGLGVRDTVAVRARRPGPHGHVLIADGFARHERGLAGFDPDAQLDGLEFALAHPSAARSEFVWNVLLVPNRPLVAGHIEFSVRDGFADSTQQPARSAIGEAAARAAWLPGPDGRFHRPATVSLDDLPPTFARDEGLAAALGMSQPAVAQAARQLGLPPGVLWGLSAYPDLVALVEREIAARRGGG
jgi:hypothetical protein